MSVGERGTSAIGAWIRVRDEKMKKLILMDWLNPSKKNPTTPPPPPPPPIITDFCHYTCTYKTL